MVRKQITMGGAFVKTNTQIVYKSSWEKFWIFFCLFLFYSLVLKGRSYGKQLSLGKIRHSQMHLTTYLYLKSIYILKG